MPFEENLSRNNYKIFHCHRNSKMSTFLLEPFEFLSCIFLQDTLSDFFVQKVIQTKTLKLTSHFLLKSLYTFLPWCLFTYVWSQVSICIILCRYWEHPNKYSRAANTGEHSRSRRAARDDSNRNTCSLYIQTDPLLWRHVREGFSDVSIAIKLLLLTLLLVEKKVLRKILGAAQTGEWLESPH